MFGGIFEFTAIDLIFFVLLVYVIYILFFKKYQSAEVPIPKIEPLEKQDMTVEQMLKYNGVDDPHICIAIFGNIYDVTRGKDFYGPDGPYGALAGHDATRALALMDITLVKNYYDDISDMTECEIEDAKEWHDRLRFKYPLIGRLLAPGEEPELNVDGEDIQATES